MVPPPKRNKAGKPESAERRFSSAVEISRGLRSQDEQGLLGALTSLRNQLTVKYNEPPLPPDDGRIQIVKEWVEASPGAKELFDLWSTINQRQMALSAMVISLTSCLLTLLSIHYPDQHHGLAILKNLFLPQWYQKLNTNLHGTHSESILVTMKLYVAMSSFAGGRERKIVMEVFAWDNKVSKLLGMRRRGRGEVKDILSRPDIRTLYILFILSFVDKTSSASLKTVFLEQHKESLAAIFRGLSQDSYQVVHLVLEKLWGGLWSDTKLKKTLKISLFNETVLSHLHKLYERGIADGGDAQENIPADLVHHFLLAISTHPGTGVCFRDNGWYPREENPELGGGGQRQRKIYNKILANFLKILRVNEDLRQQELAIKIMTACPELVAGYWAAAALTLEPRLSSKWLANIAFLGAVISLPTPTTSFLLPGTAIHHPTPPSISIIIENILPTNTLKIHLTKGLQSPSPLVRHSTALTLVKCLRKYDTVVTAFQGIADTLEEEEDGQWRQAVRALEAETRKRIPEFQVIIAFSQQKSDGTRDRNPSDGRTVSATLRPLAVSIISESALRILWLYHKCLPSLVAEARFDSGKLLSSFLGHWGGEVLGHTVDGWDMLRRLHVLRLLKESEQFLWSGKAASHSNLRILLQTYLETRTTALRREVGLLLRHAMAGDPLFQHDPEEVYLWLECIPLASSKGGTKSPDGAVLLDGGAIAVKFLEECFLRCSRTPYKYLEDLSAVTPSPSSLNKGPTEESVAKRPELFPSPALMTMVEQLSILVEKEPSPSDLYSLSVFVRHLIFRLAQKVESLWFTQAIVERVDRIFSNDVLPSYPSITKAVRREVRILRTCLAGFEDGPHSTPGIITDQMQTFLVKIEGTPLDSSEGVRMTAASELVDWVRLADHSLHPSEALRLTSSIEKLHPDSVKPLVESFHPDQDLFWRLLSNSTVAFEASFDWAFVQTFNTKFREAECREKLITMIGCLTLPVVKRVLTLICHRVEAARKAGYVGIEGLLWLLGDVMTLAKQNFAPKGLDAVKEFVISRLNRLKVLCTTPVPRSIRDALGGALLSIFQSDDSDRSLLDDIVKHWLTILVEEKSLGQEILSASSLWIRFAFPEDLFVILDKLLSGEFNEDATTEALEEFIDSVFLALGSFTSIPKVSSALNERLGSLSEFCLSETGHSAVVRSVFAQLLKRSLPLGYDGYPPENGVPLPHVLAEARDRWARRLKPLAPGIRIETFLSPNTWTATHTDIITPLFYRSRVVRTTFTSWLERRPSNGLGADLLVPLLHGFLDSSPSGYEIETRTWDGYFSQLLDLVWNQHASTPEAVQSVALILQFSKDRTHFVSMLSTRLENSSVENIGHGVLSLASKLWSVARKDSEVYVEAVVDHTMQWVVRRLSDGSGVSECDATLFGELDHLIRQTKSPKAYLAEPVIASGIRHHIQTQEVISLCTTLVQHCGLKPASSNKQLQSVVQHPKFFVVCNPSAPYASRDAVIRLLRELFYIHPQNSCQPSHLEPLRVVYGGTLSTSDRTLISIFRLFENHEKLSCTSLLSTWSSSGDARSGDALGAVLGLDAAKVFHTCLNYPRELKFNLEHEYHEASGLKEELYDPFFLNLIFSRVVSGNSLVSALSWVQFFRTNIVSVVIRSLSSKDDAFREQALFNLSGLWKILESADMQEKPHVIYILNLLRDRIPAPMDGDSPPRLPTYATLILCHAIRGIFYPSNFIYPLTARFLLQRAELDVQDVPMFLGMLYSGSDENWRRERVWMIRFLADGMTSAQDWKVLRKRHAWDLVASMFQGFSQDSTLRNGILEFLIKITSNRYAVNSLLLRSGLLSWIEIQVHGVVTEQEALQWCRVLENILTISDVNKMESVTEGQWRKSAMRVVERILGMTDSPSVLRVSVNVISRLETISTGDPDLQRVVDLALKSVNALESGLRVHLDSELELRSKHALGDASLVLWGEVVVTLWRVVMGFDIKPLAWDELTLRLLVWRCIAGEKNAAEGEWCRQEVLRNLRSADDG